LETATLICQVIIALGIFNVWLLRPQKATAYRGGSATTMKEEFSVYGFPPWFMKSIGALKVGLAVLLIVGIWVPALVQPAAIGFVILMAGAVVMHIKVKDSFKKTLPALTMLLLSLFVAAT
jgi:hypothetical protein